MSTHFQLALFHADPKVSAGLRLGFEKEGASVLPVEESGQLPEALIHCQLAIVGGSDAEDARGKLIAVKEAIVASKQVIPVLYFGNAISKHEALASGASEFLARPAFLRDVVTVSKLMATPLERRTQSISGELGEHYGLFYLVRALGKVQYNGVLTLIRGRRRGELRFHEGDVTSGQLGSLVGLAALHQLLLWSNGRFDLREEKVVRRGQIPLSKDELLKDCERFLSEIRNIAGVLSPSMVLEANEKQERSDLPKQVIGVLRLFDGTNSVADVLEDSPYQNFETLRIACRLLEQKYVVSAISDAPTHLKQEVLNIDEWLVGGARELEVPPSASNSGKPVSPPKGGAKRKKRASRRSTQPPVSGSPERNEQSWSDVLPSPYKELDIAQVVPATAAVGEIRTTPSSRALAEMKSPKAPSPEGLQGQREVLTTIFIDEGLALASEAVSEKDAFSWEEKTSPAIPPAKRKASDDEHSTAKVASELVETTAKPEVEVEPPKKQNQPDSRVEQKEKSVHRSEEVEHAHKRVKATAADAVTAYTAAAEALQFPQRDDTAEPVSSAKSSEDESEKVIVDLGDEPSPKAKTKSTNNSQSGKKSKRKNKKSRSTKNSKDAKSNGVLSSKKKTKSEASSSFVQVEDMRATPEEQEGSKGESSKDKAGATKVAQVAAAAEAAAAEALDFSAEEEDFFSRGKELSKAEPIAVESFEDLDEHYEIPKTFWGRFMSDPWRDKRKKKN